MTYDRIDEIGIIDVTEDGAKEWTTLINPRAHIPEGVQLLTCITNVKNFPAKHPKNRAFGQSLN